MHVPTAIACAALILLAGCGPKSRNQEESPGAAERYLANVSANEHPSDRAAAANDMVRVSPSSGKPDASIGQAPIFSREPVPPRKQP